MMDKVIQIAKEAGTIILKCREKGLKTKTKTNEFDFVTTADIKSEEHILKGLKKIFPKDAILSEETQTDYNIKNERVWMVDPLDGTKDFKNGGDGYSIMIGLCLGGKPVFGVVYAPSKELLYYAEKGKGAFIEKDGKTRKLKTNDVGSIGQARMVTRFVQGEKRLTDALIDSFEIKEKIPESSVGIKIGLIASGDAEIHIHTNPRGNKWDTCAPQIILEEAGGKITDWNGNKLDYNQNENNWSNSFVATNSVLHILVVDKIKSYRSIHGEVF